MDFLEKHDDRMDRVVFNVRNELEEKNGMKFTKEQNYVFYINQAFPDAEQRINAFFELCNRFFREIDSSIEKKY